MFLRSLFLLLCFSLFAEVEYPSFQGLILVSDLQDIDRDGYEKVEGLSIHDLEFPGDPSQFHEWLVREYAGKHLNEETVDLIKHQLINHYYNQGRPVVRVISPEQDISNGVLQLYVIEGKLGEVTMKGNKWFKSKEILSRLHLKDGEVIDTNKLSKDLERINHNPYRVAQVVYKPGEDLKTTDLEIVTLDRLPFRVYTGIDNYGNDITGNNRIFGGFSWGQVFGTDQTLSYQFTTASNIHRFQAHTLYYDAPLSWNHYLNIYGGYSHIHSDFHVPNFQGLKMSSNGNTYQGSLRYLIPVSICGTISQVYTLGFDFKRTNNNLALGDVSVSKRNVNLFQLMLGYHSGIDLEPVTASFEIEGFVSPGQWLANQSEADFQSLSPNSKPRYFYARSAVSLELRFHKAFSVNNFLRGQWATTNLLPSEEFGVGGYNTVRGYKEREVNGDNAFVWNFELRTTPVSLLNYVFHKKKYPDKLQVLIFYDLGWESVKRATAVEDKRELLMSVGPGLRYNIRTNVNLKVDWGIQLKNVHTPVGTFSNHNRLHFSLIVGY